MTNYEFKAEYDRLKEAFPNHGFQTASKTEAIARAVMSLDRVWWKVFVLQMIASQNPFTNILGAAKAELTARANKQNGERNSMPSEFGSKEAYQDYLKRIGAQNALEAVEIEKTRKKNGEAS